MRQKSAPPVAISLRRLALALAAVGFAERARTPRAVPIPRVTCWQRHSRRATLQPSSSLVSHVPWPDAPKTFTPGGFVPSETNPSAVAPVCAPGFSLLLAPIVTIGGLNALFWVTPIAGALLVWMGFLAGTGAWRGRRSLGRCRPCVISVSPAGSLPSGPADE